VHCVGWQAYTAAVLARAAEGADQLVIGARGHGGLGGLHLGSVTLAVLHHARLPVAVARPAATG